MFYHLTRTSSRPGCFKVSYSSEMKGPTMAADYRDVRKAVVNVAMPTSSS